ncbi:hypothetical protein I601_2323 [Nocardioides dokdonensis FR1436]|uniref:Lipoprotein n=1 Tax=Nocardioides dokdonensis FR1436 TaxID=1300347 RepID=A0A1A9GKX5_9ACTN|nr:hypothetical protein [Nocardioides dokdonensis]ANH38746.1 hypothetical protein I601_2323 [Nocardioides dokdonensis FR1436]
MTRSRPVGPALALALALVVLGAACGAEPRPDAVGAGIDAELRQSSLDAARGQMQVWVANDTGAAQVPTSVRYLDDRLAGPLEGDRLRPMAAGAQIGFGLPLPLRPPCGAEPAPRGAQRVEVRTDEGDTWRSAVADETDVLGRYLASRCLELAVAEVAGLRWLPVRHDGRRGSTGTLTLAVRPTGEPGHVLFLDTVSGTPLLGAAGAAHWSPGVRVRSDGEPLLVPLEARAARCDDHVFMEGGGSTAFRVGLRLDDRGGQLLVRMGERATASAVAFVRDSCGL